MKKSILILLVVLLSAVVVIWLMKAPIASSYLTNKLRVPVSIMGVKIRRNHTRITNLKINNPKGSKTRTAFSSKTIDIDYTIKTLSADPSIVDSIKLDNVFLGVEFYNALGTQNNWTKITQNLSKEDKSSKEVIIRKLIINDLNVEIYKMGIGALFGQVQKKHIDRLEFYNISSIEGFPTKELIQKIFGSSGLQDYLKNLFQPQNMIKMPFNLFGENEEIPSE